MAFYKVTKKQSGGGGTTILKGSTNPSSAQGSNGQLYLKYGVLDAALLHFEDSATTDEFGNTTWTTEGTATISADQHKFGSKSLYLNGSGYLRSPVGDDMFNFGSGDFTVSMWIYPLFASRYALFSMSADCRIGSDIFQGKGSANMWMSSSGSWNVIQSDNDTATSGMGDIPLNANEWTHIAYIRKGDTCKMFVNGQLAKATNVPSGTSVYWTGNDFFQIGRWAGGGYMYNGYIDELLVMKGVAYWDSAFTPPTQPFSLSDFTNVVVDSYAKDNGSWQSLRGTPIDDISNVEPGLAKIILANGQISDRTSGEYKYPVYEDISSYDTVNVKIYGTIDNVYYEDYISINCSRLPQQFSNIRLYDENGNSWNKSLNLTFSSTALTSIAYTGTYENLYIDMIAIEK